MGWSFGFLLKKSVYPMGMFQLLLSSAYTQSRPFMFLTSLQQWEGWVCNRIWERTQMGQLTLTERSDIPYCMTSCSAYKCQKRRRKGGDVQCHAVYIPKWWRPTFLKLVEQFVLGLLLILLVLPLLPLTTAFADIVTVALR